MEKHHRRSIRLRGYDYTQPGAYFITICIEGRQCLLGEIAGDQMLLNEAGRMVETTWQAIPTHYSGVEIDAFVVMPNHIHGIIVLVGAPLVGARRKNDHAPLRTTTKGHHNKKTARGVVGAPLVGACYQNDGGFRRVTTRVTPTNVLPSEGTHMLGDVVGSFKSLTTDAYIHGVKNSGWPSFQGYFWQRNYYEHVIRNEKSLEQIRQYIEDNPACWAFDSENPSRTRP